MHHVILPFLDYRLVQWNSRCSGLVVSPSKFALLTGSRNGNLDKKRVRVFSASCVGRTAVTPKMPPGQSEGPKG